MPSTTGPTAALRVPKTGAASCILCRSAAEVRRTVNKLRITAKMVLDGPWNA